MAIVSNRPPLARWRRAAECYLGKSLDVFALVPVPVIEDFLEWLLISTVD